MLWYRYHGYNKTFVFSQRWRAFDRCHVCVDSLTPILCFAGLGVQLCVFDCGQMEFQQQSLYVRTPKELSLLPERGALWASGFSLPARGQRQTGSGRVQQITLLDPGLSGATAVRELFVYKHWHVTCIYCRADTHTALKIVKICQLHEWFWNVYILQYLHT